MSLFIDQARINVKAGDGGHGSIAFRREKFIPYGGPAGGDGGKGGDIWVEASASLITLRDFRYQRHYKADRGSHGEGSKRTGRSGEDLVIRVPVGTQIRDAETGDIIADLVDDGQRALVASGGRGGRGNARFATPTDRAPRRAEDGALGEEKTLHLELKLLADVGLVGLPNAGKSSFLARVSHAAPKIADYPFTTLSPNLGLVEPSGYLRPFVLADIPGLIEGAHAGAGLGLQFLRHIERTRVLLYIVDASADDEGGPLEALTTVRSEVGLHNEDLLTRPALVLLNKIDLPDAREQARSLAAELERRGYEVYAVSAATGEGIDAVVMRTAELLAGSAGPGAEREPHGVHQMPG
jgi:GTP-binding protein